MRRIAFIACVFLTPFSHALTPEPMSAEIASVKYTLAKWNHDAKLPDLNGPVALVDVTGRLDPVRKRLGVDRIYFDEMLSRVLMIKFGLTPDREHAGRILRDQADSLIHGRTKSGIPFAAYFSGFSPAEVNAISNRLQFNRDAHAALSFPGRAGLVAQMLIPSACAADGSSCKYEWPGLMEAKRTLSAWWDDKCLSSSLLANVLGVADAASSFSPSTSVMNLLGSGLTGELWTAPKYIAGLLRSFTNSFMEAIKQRVGGFFKLDMQDRIELICKSFKALLSDGALMMASGGVLITVAAVNAVLAHVDVSKQLSAKLKALGCALDDAPARTAPPKPDTSR